MNFKRQIAKSEDVLRRLYSDLVKRRSMVRITPAKAIALDHSPIFIIGVYRSGTTLLRYIIDSHSHISCPPESNFLAPLAQLATSTMYGASLASMGFDQAHVQHKLRELAIYFFGNYAASHGKVRWADKTPDYVDHLDFLRALFPEAQFIMIYRNGLNQAHSYTREGAFMRATLAGYCHEGEDLRVGAVRYWKEKVGQMMDFEQRYPQQCIRVRYEDLCLRPEQETRRLFAFLQEEWEPAVLEYHKFAHDKGSEDGRVGATKGVFVNENHYNHWPQTLLQACNGLAEPVLARLGYQLEVAR